MKQNLNVKKVTFFEILKNKLLVKFLEFINELNLKLLIFVGSSN